MLIYSVMPFNAVFPPEYSKNETRRFGGGYIETDKDNKIVRVISTNLKMYMDYKIGDTSKF